MGVAVRTENIDKTFSTGQEEIKVLHQINLTLYFGELAMLVGPSGCGKTTLLSILTGILSPTSGQVWIGDTELTALSPLDQVLFRRQHLGFVFQQFNLLSSLNACENVIVPLLAAGKNFHKSMEVALDFLESVGMREHSEKYPNQLSGGQQQRVAFARALINQPKLIVCDEPTSALDAQTGQKVMKVLRRIAIQPHVAVVVVTHDPRILHFADRVIHMSDGEIEKEEVKDISL